MTVHCVLVLFGHPSSNGASTAANSVNSQLDSFTKRVVDEEMTVQQVSDDELPWPDHYRGVYRVADTHDKNTVISDVENELESIGGLDWYQILYHECEHNDVSATSNDFECVYSVETEYGVVPDSV